MTNLKFKESIHVEVIEPDTVFLISENNYHLLTGPIYKNLVPLLDGQHSVAAMADALNGTVSFNQLMYALKKLQARGHIVEVDNRLPPPQAAFWHMMNIPVPVVGQQLMKTCLAIQAVGSATTQPLQSALEANGVQIASQGDLVVVLTDDYLHPELAKINNDMHTNKQEWLLAKIVGEIIWIGPIFKPEETACWECMAARIRGNRLVESFVIRQRENEDTLFKRIDAALQATITLGANLLATEITKWIATGKNKSGPLYNHLMNMSVQTMKMARHTITRRPHCSVCGDPTRYSPNREPQPIELKSTLKKYTLDGGHRTLSPEEASAHYEHLISPITGIVTHLFNALTDSRGLAYSYIAGHEFGMKEHNIATLYRTLRGRSGGKGMTRSQAKMSAIGEAVERYSTIYRNTHEITIQATYDELGEKAIYPNRVWLFSEKQYENRITWNSKQKSGYHFVPKPFPSDMEFAWSPYWSLTNKTFKYYPAFCTYFYHPELHKGYGQSHSNGCASGHTLEEAIYQGLLELIERDSIAIWWYNRLRYPRLDLDSFNNPYTHELEAYYADQNRSLWVIDITADLGIPTFAAISGRLDSNVEDIIVGMGAHLDPHIALLRSLSEMNQFLSNVQKNPDGTVRYLNDVQETVEWFKTATMENNAYLKPDDSLPARKLSDFEALYSNDLAEDILICVDRVRQAGMETLVIDLSQPDVSMKVCRVIVPGLRHFWRRLAPGRLYDVPVELGLLDKPTSEEALNPVSMFF